jgi:excisionase family DNA binding protein
MENKPPRFTTLNETAATFRTHPRTLRRWCSEGKIPFLRLGRRYLFREEDIAQLQTEALADKEVSK